MYETLEEQLVHQLILHQYQLISFNYHKQVEIPLNIYQYDYQLEDF